MSKLLNELQRLYFLQEQQWQGSNSDEDAGTAAASAGLLTPELVATCLEGEATTATVANVALNLVSPAGMARTMVVGFERAADWAQVAKLYQGVQEDLELTAPAISVSGRAGYHLWFSLAECVPVAQARAFLDALRLKYLADLPLASLKLCPDVSRTFWHLVPAMDPATGKWSAFIDPTMGAMFVDEPGLGTAPNMDRQADILSALASIKAEDFQRALKVLDSHSYSQGAATASIERSAGTQVVGAGEFATDVDRMRSRLTVGNNYSDPKSFLLAVMNDPSASANQRIEAAKALLPYFNHTESKSP